MCRCYAIVSWKGSLRFKTEIADQRVEQEYVQSSAEIVSKAMDFSTAYVYRTLSLGSFTPILISPMIEKYQKDKTHITSATDQWAAPQNTIPNTKNWRSTGASKTSRLNYSLGGCEEQPPGLSQDIITLYGRRQRVDEIATS